MARRVLAAFALSLVIAACGGDDGSDGGIATIEDSLAMLPEGEAEETVIWGDVTRAAELAGVEAPGGTDDVDAVIAYLSALTGRPAEESAANPVMVVTPTVAHVERAAQIEEFVDDVGWSILDVERFVERATPPDTVTVLEGDFSEASLDDALGPPEDGAWVAGDPDEAPNPQDITAARPIGEAQWLALDDGILTVTTGVDATAEAAAVRDGDEPSLADDEALAGLASALDGAEAYAAMLARPGFVGPAPNITEEQMAELCAEGLPEPTTAVGAGAAAADDGSGRVLVALAHDSSDAATSNAAAIERIIAEGRDLVTLEPWSERLAVDEVDVDDNVVLATLRPVDDGRIDLWYRLIVERSGLISSC